MKTQPFLLSIVLLALGACSKAPQEPNPAAVTAPTAVATPASDPSLPSASVVANAPRTPDEAPASAPAGMAMPASGSASKAL